jgi:hypothetical protein
MISPRIPRIIANGEPEKDRPTGGNRGNRERHEMPILVFFSVPSVPSCSILFFIRVYSRDSRQKDNFAANRANHRQSNSNNKQD